VRYDRTTVLPAIAGLMLALFSSPLFAQTKLLRFPAIHGDKIAFTYAGDIWIAPVTGGTATRLTAHSGMEVFARFSPDGKWVAFTGQYDGDEQVYVVPTGGGEPKQLTYYPAHGPLTPRWGWDNQVYGWTDDGKSIIFRSMRDAWTTPLTRLYTMAVTGGPAEPLPMPTSGAGDFSPDGTRIVYSPEARDFRPEKRYSGGTANQLYIYDVNTNDAKRISDGPRSTRDPMWIGNIIYFNSDRTGTFNLYMYDVASGKVAQVTTSTTWDVRWPSSDRQGRIVYELNGELVILDTKTGRSTPIPITVPDDGLWKRPSRIPAANAIEDFELSPRGERALFVARGDVFTAPIEKGPTRNLTHSSGAHDKWARWSPDGSKIAYISDRSGEEELWVSAQDGSGAPEQITKDGKAMRYAPAWSSDGKRIAFSDKDGKIFVYSFDDAGATGRLPLRQIVDAPRGQVRDYVWSPRSHFLAFSMAGANGFNAVYIWSEKDGQVRRVTDELFNAQNPAWDPEGHDLFYLSDRTFAPLISSVEFNYATNRTTGIFAVALRKDGPTPFPAESDEVTIGKEEKKETAKPKEPDKTDLAIDFDGLGARVVRVPIEADNYGGLSAKKNYLLYIVQPPPYYGREADKKPVLKLYSIKDRKETTIAEDAGDYALSLDGSKVLVRSGRAFSLYDATPNADKTKKTVSTAGLMVDRVPTEEWTQIFNEVWRRYRDWFYVENMHGFDWDALRRQYAPLLEYVAHRSDLNYVISEMVSELTVQHAYIEGGDFVIPPRPRAALPGARFALDRQTGRYRITKIFAGQNEEENYRSPLTEVGLNVAVGDYVLAIDNQELRPDEDPYRLLRNKADRPVALTVNSKPTVDGARQVIYNPIADETDLLYLNWVLGNRKRVQEATGGRVAYLHVPDMGAKGISEFIKWYYGQVDKDALIVDVRVNGGGNVSRMLIERLRRVLLGVEFGRTDDRAGTYPDGMILGPKVAILDENSASDGDIFPYMFREAGIGPLIGKRSWGGVVGISGRGPLIDGGIVYVPESATASAKGQWVIEGHGVDPDIEVENDPKSVIAGRDPQLERAIAEVMKKLKEQPAKLPGRPAPPIKTEKK
jgi:tricorn protease